MDESSQKDVPSTEMIGRVNNECPENIAELTEAHNLGNDEKNDKPKVQTNEGINS